MQLQLTLEQHKTGLHGATYTWVFFQKICTAVLHDPRSVESTNAELHIQKADCKVICEFLTALGVSAPSPRCSRVNGNWKASFILHSLGSIIIYIPAFPTRPQVPGQQELCFFSSCLIFFILWKCLAQRISSVNHLNYSALEMCLIIVFILFDFYWSYTECLSYHKIFKVHMW